MGHHRAELAIGGQLPHRRGRKSLLANAVQLSQASVAEARCWSLSCKRNALKRWIVVEQSGCVALFMCNRRYHLMRGYVSSNPTAYPVSCFSINVHAVVG
jgi:hypothetical protein